jgi:hypothetical protein
MYMFWTLKLRFYINILAIFGLVTILATVEKIGLFFIFFNNLVALLTSLLSCVINFDYKKCFIGLAPWSCVIKIYIPVIYI